MSRPEAYDLKGYGITNLESKLFPLLKNNELFSSPRDVYENETFRKAVRSGGTKAILDFGTLDDDTGRFRDNDNCGLVLYVPETTILLFEYGDPEHEDILRSELESGLKRLLEFTHTEIDVTTSHFVEQFASRFRCQGIRNAEKPDYDHTVKTKGKLVLCPKCKGHGAVEIRTTLYDSEYRTCPYCDGKRIVYQKKTVTHKKIS